MSDFDPTLSSRNAAGASVAVYWDFENVHAALLNRERGEDAYRRSCFTPQDPVVKLEPVVQFASSVGDIAIHRAYANWQWFSRYRIDLLQHAIDLVQLFPAGGGGKNGADIRMSLDVLQDVQRYDHVTHVVIIAGDSDYIGLAQKCRQAGKIVLGIGVEGAVNRFWMQACNAFKFYRTLVARTERLTEVELDELREEHDFEAARSLLVQAVRQLSLGNDGDAALKAAVKPLMIRIDPSFDEGNYGYSSFNAFLKDCDDLVSVRPGKHDHMVSLTPASLRLVPLSVPVPSPASAPPAAEADSAAPPDEAAATSVVETYTRILKRAKLPLVDSDLRRRVVEAFWQVSTARGATLFATFAELEQGVMGWLNQHGFADAGLDDVRKVRHLMFKSYLFELHRADGVDSGIRLKPVESPDTLIENVEKYLVCRIVADADPPVDVEALEQLLFGPQPEGAESRRVWIQDLVARESRVGA